MSGTTCTSWSLYFPPLALLCNCSFKRRKMEERRDSSARKGTCHASLMTYLQSPESTERCKEEVLPSWSCSLTSTCVPWYMCEDMHMYVCKWLSCISGLDTGDPHSKLAKKTGQVYELWVWLGARVRMHKWSVASSSSFPPIHPHAHTQICAHTHTKNAYIHMHSIHTWKMGKEKIALI